MNMDIFDREFAKFWNSNARSFADWPKAKVAYECAKWGGDFRFNEMSGIPHTVDGNAAEYDFTPPAT